MSYVVMLLSDVKWENLPAFSSSSLFLETEKQNAKYGKRSMKVTNTITESVGTEAESEVFPVFHLGRPNTKAYHQSCLFKKKKKKKKCLHKPET